MIQKFKTPEQHRKAAAEHYAKELELDKKIYAPGNPGNYRGRSFERAKDKKDDHHFTAKAHEKAATALEQARDQLNKETERGEHKPAVGGYTDHKHGGES